MVIVQVRGRIIDTIRTEEFYGTGGEIATRGAGGMVLL